MSNSNTSGAYWTHRPSPVQRSWSIQTCRSSDMRCGLRVRRFAVQFSRLGVHPNCPPGACGLCRVSSREHSTHLGGGRMAPEPREPQSGHRPNDDPDARRRAAFLEQEVELLRSKIADSPRHMRMLEDRLAEAQARVAALNDRNDRLSQTLREARDQMVALKEEIDRLAQPPSGYGVFLQAYDDGTVDIFTSGRKLRVAVSPEVAVP